MEKSKKVFVKSSEKIRAEIEMAIRNATLLPGEAINEAELATQYEVSRTPIREALIQLETQGLLTSLPRGGMVVATMNLQQLLSLWELLGQLEGVAVRLACQRMAPDDRAQIRRQHELSRAVVEADDVEGWQECNLKFHEILYGATRNPFLRQEVLRIRSRTGFYRRHAFAAQGHLRSSFDQHATVLNAIEKNDCDAAALAMIDHMQPARDAKGLSDYLMNLPASVLTQ